MQYTPDLDLAAYKNSWMHNFPLVCGKSSLILFKVLLPISQMAWNYQKRVPRTSSQNAAAVHFNAQAIIIPAPGKSTRSAML